MNKSATTVSGAAMAVAVAAVYALGELVLKNQDVLTLGAIVFGMTVVSAALTAGFTEMFKRRYPPEIRARLNRHYAGMTRDPDWKRRDHVYWFAVITGFLATEAMGSIFLLMDGDTRMIIVVVVLWTLYAATVGALIPILYRKLFYRKCDPDDLL